jgi:hypothetical protein
MTVGALYELLEHHSWRQWEEFWAQKKAWEDRHPGQEMLAKRSLGEQRFFVDANGGVHDQNPKNEDKSSHAKAEGAAVNAKEDAHTDLPPPALAPAEVVKRGAGRDARTEKPAQTETQKTKSAKKHRTKKREEEADIDPATVEIGVGIATSILGGHHGHSRREHANGHGSMNKTTTRTTTRSGTTKSSSSKSGGGGGSSGTTMNTTVGAPTISFGRGF